MTDCLTDEETEAPECSWFPGDRKVMWWDRVCISDLFTCGLMISLCVLNWAGKEKLEMPDDIVFRVQRQWVDTPRQEPGNAQMENFRLSDLLTCHFLDVLNCLFPVCTLLTERKYSFDVSENLPQFSFLVLFICQVMERCLGIVPVCLTAV